MPPFSSSQSIVLPIHGLATPLLGYLASFVQFSLSQSIVLPIHGLATPFPGYLASFVQLSLSQSIVLAIHGLALTFYLACGDWGQPMLVLSAGGGLNTTKTGDWKSSRLWLINCVSNVPRIVGSVLLAG